jgi:hypothetical protein
MTGDQCNAASVILFAFQDLYFSGERLASTLFR